MWFRKRKQKENREEGCLYTDGSAKEVAVPVLKLFWYSEQGNRAYQQDAVYTSAQGIIPLSSNTIVRVLAAVCDGMGGMEDGGRASRTAVKMLKEDFEKIRQNHKALLPDFLLSEIRRIDDVIYHFAEGGRGSGTTIAAAAVENTSVYWASAGDSRIYLLRQNKLEQITRDHNYMLHLIQNGMPPQEAKAQKGSEALISFLGIGKIRLVDGNSIQKPLQLHPRDILLLCSDGITKTIPDSQIREILLSRTSDISRKAQVLVQAAIRQNTRSQDNTSAVVLEYDNENVRNLRDKKYR